MKAILLIAFLVLPAVLATPTDFEAFTLKYNKKYTGAEYNKRAAIFERNLRIAQQHQREDPSAEHGITQFFDLTYEEWAATYLMAPTPSEVIARNCLKDGVYEPNAKPVMTTPDAWDWRDHPNVVNPVRDQGSCGSCWAFSAAQNLEGVTAVAGNPVGPLSPQFIVDCSKGCSSEWYQGKNITVCNQGCSGGWPWTAFYDVVEQKGLPSEADYPYKGVNQACKGNSDAKVVVKMSNYTCISGPDAADELKMRDDLIKYGPLSIAVNANNFFSYKNGILDPANCPTQYVNHAVLLVGYGTDAATKQDFWIVKNSWNASWGEAGYVRMARGKGLCGINMGVVTATL